MSSTKTSNMRSPRQRTTIAPKSLQQFGDVRIKLAGQARKFMAGKIVRSSAKKPITVEISIGKALSRSRDRERLLKTYVTYCMQRVVGLPDEALTVELEELKRTPQPGASPWRFLRPKARPKAATSAALERAFARADETHAALVNRADMVTGEAIAERLNLSRTTIDNRRIAGQLLALELGTKRGLRYPEWQCEFLTDPQTRSAYEKTLRTLGSLGAPAKYRFFTQTAPALGGRTPIEALRGGEFTAVAEVARTWRDGEQGGG